MWGPYPSRLRLPLAGGAPCSLGASSLSGAQGPGPPYLRLLSLPAGELPQPSLPAPAASRHVPSGGRGAGWRRARALPAAAAHAQGQRRRHARPDPWRRRRRAQPPPPSSLAARSRPLLLPPSRRFLPAAMGLGSGGRAGARLQPRRTRGDLLDPELRRRPDPPLSVRFSPPLSLCRSSPARRRSAPCSHAAAARCSARARTLAVASSGLHGEDPHGHHLPPPSRSGAELLEDRAPPPSSSAVLAVPA